MNYWINTVSRDHVETGMQGGFTQANHGSPHNLRKMERGDLLVFYSPKTRFEDGETLQKFTAIGRILDDEPYQVTMNPNFHPFRRQVEFWPCSAAPIRPLLDGLDFIENKQRWGFPFRRGMFTIERADFIQIVRAMSVAEKQLEII